ncbi:MAG TPA: methyltransferase domain-containing protein, partial [Terriglobales bacterium]|nr:methyltransferase domain-containing protein [Terriglobales bacterium]
ATQWAELSSEQIAVDLYCGAGALAFHLAAGARLVIGVEESPIAIADAKTNVRMNGFHNVRFRCGDAGDLLTQLAAELERLDVIALNPPRKGASEAVRAAILAAAPKRIVYISCDPTTLARDLDHLTTAGGYRLEQLQPYDMLPQTEHVECVALLGRVA